MPKREENQDTLRLILQKLESLESRIEKIERREGSQVAAAQPVKPALARVIKSLKEMGEPAGADEVAENAGLARNRASAYLNELSSLGYIEKKPNLRRTGSRYVFEYSSLKVPAQLRKQIEEETKEK